MTAVEIHEKRTNDCIVLPSLVETTARTFDIREVSADKAYTATANFEAVVQATEEANVNAMVGAETMTGYSNHRVTALPHDGLREVLTKHNRLTK